MRPVRPPDAKLRESLLEALGGEALAAADAEGERLTPAEALRSAGPAPVPQAWSPSASRAGEGA
jgi:hypothetical protein